MKATVVKLIQRSFVLVFVLGIVLSPIYSVAQDAEKATLDSVEVVSDSIVVDDDNSSSFNDSVQFDDMEPVFYEAAEDEVEASDSSTNMMLYVGIAVVLLIVLIVLKKVGKKKS